MKVYNYKISESTAPQIDPCQKQKANVTFKGSGHYWSLLKIIICIKTYLVTSNGEMLVVYNNLRNGTLWSNAVLEKEVFFHKISVYQDFSL